MIAGQAEAEVDAEAEKHRIHEVRFVACTNMLERTCSNMHAALCAEERS